MPEFYLIFETLNQRQLMLSLNHGQTYAFLFYAFPLFIYYSKVSKEIWQDGAEGILVVTGSQFSKMITKDVLPPRQVLSTTDPSISHPLHQTLQLRATATPRKLKKLHTTQKWCNLLWASWAPKTQTNYNTYVRKWLKCCTEEGISDPNMASCDQAMSFLSSMVYWKKGKYGTMAVACSGLSAVLAKINGQIAE